MKTPPLAYSVIAAILAFGPTRSLAQTTTATSTDTDTESMVQTQQSSRKVDLSTERPEAKNTKTAQLAEVNQPGKALAIDSSKTDPAKIYETEVTAEALEKAVLTLKFDGNSLHLVGAPQPSACVDPGLTLSDFKKVSPETDDSTSNAFETESDLNLHSASVGVRFKYKGPYKSFAACLDAHKDDTDKTDLATLDAARKTGIDMADSPRAGLLDASNVPVLGKNPALSPGYQKLKTMLTLAGCETCTKKPKTLTKLMGDVAEFGVWAAPSFMEAMIKKSLVETEARLTKATTLKELESIRADLFAYADSVNKLKDNVEVKNKLGSDIAGKIVELKVKAEELANADLKHPALYADFISETYEELAHLSGLSKQSKEDAKEQKKLWAKKGSERLEFISQRHLDDAEIRDFINTGGGTRQALQNFRCACMVPNPGMACDAAQHEYQSSIDMYGFFYNRYTSAQSMDRFLAQQGGAQGSRFNNPNLAFGSNQGEGGFPSQFGGRYQSQSNNLFALDRRIFPDAQSYNSGLSFGAMASTNASATRLFNANSFSYQPTSGSQYRVNVDPNVAMIPLNTNNLPYNGVVTDAPIKTGFSPRFDYNI